MPPDAADSPGSTPGSALPLPSSAHVLLVEDDEDTLYLLRGLLHPHLHVTAFTSFDDALAGAKAAADARPFGLFVFDLMFFGPQSGIDLIRAVRAMPPYADVPALAISAITPTVTAELCREAGFDAYLVKPFTSDSMLRAIRIAVHNRTGTQHPGAFSVVGHAGLL